MTDQVQDNTTLGDKEPHPSARIAYVWFHESIVKDPMKYIQLKEAISSTALSGNRLAQICFGTMQRLEDGQPVSDRYLLGLCWFMRDLMEEKYRDQGVSPEPDGLLPQKEVVEAVNVEITPKGTLKKTTPKPKSTKKPRKSSKSPKK